VVLWWVLRKKLREQSERSSLAWGLYLGAAQIVALITGATIFLITIATFVAGDARPRGIATGTIWLLVWAAHRRLSRREATRPSRLATVPAILGQVYALVITVGGTTTFLTQVFNEAIRSLTAAASVGDPWWHPALQSLVWAVGGAVIWWWFWTHDGVRLLRSGLADVAVILVGIMGSCLLALVGVGTVFYVLLRLVADRTEPLSQLLDPLGFALAAAATGCLVWLHYHRALLDRSNATQEASRLTVSGVALVVAASGLGVVVNATLAALAPALAGNTIRPLLLGGVSALAVGALLWWRAWQPSISPEPGATGAAARRVYLVVVFGLSAVVALITLLVIGYRFFEFLLDDVTGTSLVDRIRAPIGLLAATSLVAGYHFILWRRDRDQNEAEAPARLRLIEQVILVSGTDAAVQSQIIHDVSGASVTVWMRADAGAPSGALDVPSGASAPSAPVPPSASSEQLVEALEGIEAKRVLVLIGSDARIQVKPLEE
ncbi:MAG: DUF5671 domain-containing protein, partial [Cryobacterium sp.]|nr:DUF5671 domain-containing protein [Cryobacterium sp.]